MGALIIKIGWGRTKKNNENEYNKDTPQKIIV